MTTGRLVTVKNEDAPFYFEKLLAGLDFLSLLEENSKLSRIQIKPDREDPERLIEDMTRFYKDGTIEVIQIKHSLRADRRIGYGDLWVNNPHSTSSSQGEGKNIYKFLKSWRIHSRTGKNVKLTLLSNAPLTDDLRKFLQDTKRLGTKELAWREFRQRYADVLRAIERNCSKGPFVDKRELRSFLSSLTYRRAPDIRPLQDQVKESLKKRGVIEEMRVHAYINRVTIKFLDQATEVLSSDVLTFIDLIDTGLIQEITLPDNFISRPGLEDKVLNAIEAKKTHGGFVLLYSPSGSGKTVLLSRLATKNPFFLPYFCRIRPFEVVGEKSGYSNKNRLKSSWFKANIIQRCFEFGLIPSSVGINDSEDYVDKVFDESLNILSKKALERKDKKIVIIIDALDQIETDGYKGKSVLDAIPAINYPGVIFLLSTWGERYLPQSIKNLPASLKKETGINLYFSEDEIDKYFKEANLKLTKDQVVRVKQATDGLAISLFYLIQRIKQCGDIDSVLSNSGQVDQVFDWYQPIWNSLTVKEKDSLGYLCFHLARVQREDLKMLVQASINVAAFNELLEKIRPFIDTRRGSIEPYHDSFRRFIVKNLNPDRSYYHIRLGTYYARKTGSLYAKKYLIKHLESAGIKSPTVKKIYSKLEKENFFQKVLKSGLDDPTKVEIGKSFATYFYSAQDIENLVKYSIYTSEVYPVIEDSYVYKKANIGTQKFIAEIDKELSSPKRDHPRDQREWVFDRLALGNILKTKIDKTAISLASRFLDDSLFRINLNPNLLWDKEVQDQDKFWQYADELAAAYVNTDQYRRALNFLRSISFEKPRGPMEGFMGAKVARVHALNLRFNEAETLHTVQKASKVERLAFYLKMWKRGRLYNLKDLKRLLGDSKNERFLYDGNRSIQKMEFAEALWVYGKNDKTVRIQKIIKKLSFETPHFDRGHVYWGMGNERDVYLRLMALKSLVDKKFDLVGFYLATLKAKYKKKESDEDLKVLNAEFIELLQVQVNLFKTYLIFRKKKVDWKELKKTYEAALVLYKEKIDRVNGTDPSSSVEKNYIYHNDLENLIEGYLWIVSNFFNNKLLSTLEKIEKILSLDFIANRAGLLETLIRSAETTDQRTRDKLDGYFRSALELRKKEKLDNLSKSSNLQDLALLAAALNQPELAEQTFLQALKYSRGLWSKEDMRFYNLVDTVRTQNKEQFDEVLSHIERISNVVEGPWYWRRGLLESMAHSHLELALEYTYKFIVRGEVNINDALIGIMESLAANNSYKKTKQIIPLLNLINFRDETSHEDYEAVSKSYKLMIKLACVNNDIGTGTRLAEEYFKNLKMELSAKSRLSVLKDLSLFLENIVSLAGVKKKVDNYIGELKKAGYEEKVKEAYGFKQSNKDISIELITNYAKKDKVDSIIKLLKKHLDKSYRFDGVIAPVIPYLSYKSISKLRSWFNEQKLPFEDGILMALLGKACSENNNRALKEAKLELFHLATSPLGHYHTSLITRVDMFEFKGKKRFIRKLLLSSILKNIGSSYYLASVFLHSSESIDKHYIELKEFSYDVWNDVVKRAMKLSLSK